MTSVIKTISTAFTAHLMPEGVGAMVYRSIGSRRFRQLSPFLLLDYMKVTNAHASFPDHPHRGLETVTYVLSGTIQHEDFTGSEGLLKPGDCQIMTAGKGIVHAEIPRPPQPSSESSADSSPESEPPVASGIQLWVDLPEHLKNIEPYYRDIRASSIPVTNPAPGVTLKTLSFAKNNTISHDSRSMVAPEDVNGGITKTPMWFLYYKSSGESSKLLTPAIPKGWNSFLYVTKGSLIARNGSIAISPTNTPSSTIDGSQISIQDLGPTDSSEAHIPESSQQSPSAQTLSQQLIGDQQLNAHDIAIFDRATEIEEQIEVALPLNDEVEFLVCAGLPLNQPIHRDMFFAQLTKDALRQSKVDFKEKINGFEKAKDWKSKIAGDVKFKLHI